MAEVQLFGAWASPFSCRIEIALKMKGVEYEYIKEDLSNKSPLLLEYNPVHKKVPVLVHKGKPIAESVVILEYIDETWKQNPILPNDPYERAMARFWAKFIDETFIDTLRKALWGEDKDREKFLNEACEHLKRLDNELKNKKFFGGDNVGLVDIVATLVGFWLRAFNEALGLESNLLTDDKFPNLCKLRDEYDNCNVIKDSLPPRDKLLDFMRVRYETSK